MKHGFPAGTVTFAFLLLCSGALADLPLSEVEVLPDKKATGDWRDYTVRLRPSANQHYDRLVFDCILRQEIEWTNADGKKYTKIHEPAAFTYRRKNVKFVRDLDVFISFKAPESRERIEKIYGKKMFMQDVAVIISHIKISAYKGKKLLWKIKVPAEGKYDPIKKQKILDKQTKESENTKSRAASDF